MILSKRVKQKRHYKVYQRKSLLIHFKSKHYFKSKFSLLNNKFRSRSHVRDLFDNIYQIYRSLCLLIALIIRIFLIIDRITRKLFIFIETILQIIRVIHGWIQMVRSILSALHLIVNRLMILSSYVHRICYLLTLLFEPFSNGSFEKAVRSFSNFLFYYYSSNGACYTLKARTNHIIRQIRARWTKNQFSFNDNNQEIYYDAFDGEYAEF